MPPTPSNETPATAADTASSQERIEAQDDAYNAAAPGSLGALIPWPDDPDEWPDIDPEEALDLFLDWTSQRGIELWPHQEEALMSLVVGDHVVLGTPTGLGQVARRTGHVLPGRVHESARLLHRPHKSAGQREVLQPGGRVRPGQRGHDHRRHAPSTAAPPSSAALPRSWRTTRCASGEDADIGCVAMDEFHFFSDPDRGWAWQVPLLTLPHTQFLLMSATLGDMTRHRRQAGGEDRHGCRRNRRCPAPGAAALRMRGHERWKPPSSWRCAPRRRRIYVVHFCAGGRA